MAVAAVLAEQVDNGVHGAFREINSNRHDVSIKTSASSKPAFRLPEKLNHSCCYRVDVECAVRTASSVKHCGSVRAVCVSGSLEKSVSIVK